MEDRAISQDELRHQLYRKAELFDMIGAGERWRKKASPHVVKSFAGNFADRIKNAQDEDDFIQIAFDAGYHYALERQIAIKDGRIPWS